MKTMATRKRCKLSRTSPEFENVIKRLLCVRTFHTRIGGDLTPGIINRGRPANAEQMGLQGNAKYFNIFPLGPLDSTGKNGHGQINLRNTEIHICLFIYNISLYRDIYVCCLYIYDIYLYHNSIIEAQLLYNKLYILKPCSMINFDMFMTYETITIIKIVSIFISLHIHFSCPFVIPSSCSSHP
uniref:AP20 region protein 1 n=1 Tax=Neovison vison TaxID=452646 RepID=A0A8C7CA64_NEOVI